jgi:hypothetical protein
MQYRIGDRDPVTGLYTVIWPDGSKTLNGLKVFNAAHQSGDPVLAMQRSDGLMILDSVKAVESVLEIGKLRGFGEQPIGYLAGQVWNNEDEIVLPVISVEFAPGSPTSLAPNIGDFVVRISVDRPQSKDLIIKLQFTGTAAINHYNTTGLDANQSAILPAGAVFYDFFITPLQTQGFDETIVLTIQSDSSYTVGSPNSVTGTILAGGTTNYRIRRLVGISSGGSIGMLGNNVSLGGSTASASNLIACVFQNVDATGIPFPVTNDLTFEYVLFGSAKGNVNFVAPSGSTVYPLATVGQITILAGSASAILLIQPIVLANSGGTFQVGVDGVGGATNVTTYGGIPAVYISSPATAKIDSITTHASSYPGSFPGIPTTLSGGYPWYFDIFMSDCVVNFTGTAVYGLDYTTSAVQDPNDPQRYQVGATGQLVVTATAPYPGTLKTVIVTIASSNDYDAIPPSTITLLV